MSARAMQSALRELKSSRPAPESAKPPVRTTVDRESRKPKASARKAKTSLKARRDECAYCERTDKSVRLVETKLHGKIRLCPECEALVREKYTRALAS